MTPQKVYMLRKSKAAARLGAGEGGSQVGVVDGFDSRDLDCMNCVDCSVDSESWAVEAVNSCSAAALSKQTATTQLIILRAGDPEEAVGLYHEMRSQPVDVEEAEVKISYCFGGEM